MATSTTINVTQETKAWFESHRVSRVTQDEFVQFLLYTLEQHTEQVDTADVDRALDRGSSDNE